MRLIYSYGKVFRVKQHEPTSEAILCGHWRLFREKVKKKQTMQFKPFTPFKPTVEDKNVLNAMVFKGEQGDEIRR